MSSWWGVVLIFATLPMIITAMVRGVTQTATGMQVASPVRPIALRVRLVSLVRAVPAVNVRDSPICSSIDTLGR
jgi:hypothetical protein